jgi:hypothetical protein
MSQGERMQFTAHLQDIGPCDEQPRCEAIIRFLHCASRESSLTLASSLCKLTPVGVLVTGHHAVRCVHTFSLSTLLSRRRETGRPLQLLSFESVFKLLVP